MPNKKDLFTLKLNANISHDNIQNDYLDYSMSRSIDGKKER